MDELKNLIAADGALHEDAKEELIEEGDKKELIDHLVDLDMERLMEEADD